MEWNGMEWNGMEWNGMQCEVHIPTGTPLTHSRTGGGGGCMAVTRRSHGGYMAHSLTHRRRRRRRRRADAVLVIIAITIVIRHGEPFGTHERVAQRPRARVERQETPACDDARRIRRDDDTMTTRMCHAICHQDLVARTHSHVS